jgi:hypothetical protein
LTLPTSRSTHHYFPVTKISQNWFYECRLSWHFLKTGFDSTMCLLPFLNQNEQQIRPWKYRVLQEDYQEIIFREMHVEMLP